jgi:DNA invertase Pin-like site-specific DNA recombinase
MNPSIKAVGYIRCSTDQQEDSPDQQKLEIQAYANKHGLDIIEWYVDFGKSGTTFDQRPEFQRLKRAVESNPHFHQVVCYDESRWGRAIDAEENTYWRVYFRKRGVDVVLVKTSIDPKHEFAPMLKAFEGVQASQYSKKLSELTIRGQRNNGMYSSGGTSPYGYRRVAVNIKTGARRDLGHGDWCVKKQEKVLWVLGDPGEVEVVKMIFEQKIKGTPLIGIAKYLNDQGISCARRGKWRNKDQKWGVGTVKSILENPAYYGARAYNRFSSSKIRAQQEGWEERNGTKNPVWRMDKSKWVLQEGAHDPIVTKEEWIKANTPSKTRKLLCQPKPLVPYLLTGLIKCDKCGFAFQGQSTKYNGKNYYRYICGGYNSKRVCDYCQVNRDLLEAFVLDGIDDLLSQNVMVEKVQHRLARMADMQTGDDESKARFLEQEARGVKEGIERILSAIEKGAPYEMCASKLNDLAERKASIEKRKEALVVKERKRGELRAAAEAIAEFARGFQSRFADADHLKRKEMIQRCLGGIVIDRTAKVARCYLRSVPIVGGQAGQIVEGIENAKGIPESPISLRTAAVPGTGLEPARPRGH